MLDMLVLPSLLVEKHRTELTNEQGKLDISKPYTQLCIRELMKEMFETFPQLDGLADSYWRNLPARCSLLCRQSSSTKWYV